MNRAIAQGFSIKQDLLDQARARAAAEGRSFSNYVADLIRRDLGESISTPNLNGNTSPRKRHAQRRS